MKAACGDTPFARGCGASNGNRSVEAVSERESLTAMATTRSVAWEHRRDAFWRSFTGVGSRESVDPSNFSALKPRGLVAWRVAAAAMMAAVTATFAAPTASADFTGELKSAVQAKRGRCPALQSDPVLDQVALRANLETQAYVGHTARFQPMEDPMPLLRQASYPAGKGKMLSGFADPQQFADPQHVAIHGATLFGWDSIPDCSYNRYGADAATEPNSGKAFVVVVLVGN